MLNFIFKGSLYLSILNIILCVVSVLYITLVIVGIVEKFIFEKEMLKLIRNIKSKKARKTDGATSARNRD